MRLSEGAEVRCARLSGGLDLQGEESAADDVDGGGQEDDSAEDREAGGEGDFGAEGDVVEGWEGCWLCRVEGLDSVCEGE